MKGITLYSQLDEHKDSLPHTTSHSFLFLFSRILYNCSSRSNSCISLILAIFLILTLFIYSQQTSLTPLNISSSTYSPIIANNLNINSDIAHNNEGITKKVHIKYGEVSNVMQWAVATFKMGATTERHIHNSMSEIFHIKRGIATFTFDDSTHTLQEDDSIVIPPRTYHIVTNSGTEDLVMVYGSIAEG